MERKPMNFESRFDIKKVHFDNVSREFERKFKERYSSALSMMADDGGLTNASGANTLGVLEKMAQQIRHYNSSSDFEKSYLDTLNQYERFTET